MATTYPLTTLAAQISATGITAPSYDDVYASLQASFQLIYGADAYIAPDSQDGQWIAIIAKAITDCNQAVIAAYGSFAPSTAVGVGLSNSVKINGIQRQVATHSQVLVTLTGVAGSTITSGQVADVNGNKWNLPASVVIPPAGFINVTATADEVGNLEASVGTVTKILTPTAGWQSVTNPTAASPGAAVESDGELRLRQQKSTALNSQTALRGIYASVAALDGVTAVKIYENDTDVVDANGLPGHSISLVIQGGDVSEIAATILNKKGEGVATYGTTTGVATDAAGISRNINYFVPTEQTIDVKVSLHAMAGYTSVIAGQIKQALVDHINALDIGSDVFITRLYVPAQLGGGSLASTFELVSVEASIHPAVPASTDITIAFNEKAVTTLGNITIVVV